MHTGREQWWVALAGDLNPAERRALRFEVRWDAALLPKEATR